MELGSAATALGRLVGLLSGTSDDVFFDANWFHDPLGALRKTGTRLDALADLAASVLGQPDGTSPDVFSGARWYRLSNPLLGTPTPLHFVIGAPAQPAGQIGVGLLDRVELRDLAVEAFVYIPFASYGDADDAGDAALLLGTANGPLQLRLRVARSSPFRVGAVSFDAMQLDARLYLAAEDPSFTLAFEGLTGTGKPAQYDRLADLLDGDVLEWIAEVVVQGGPWLSQCVAGQISIGDLLATGGFFDQDAEGDYGLALGGLRGKTPQQIAIGLAFGVLDGLAAVDFPVVPLPGGGVFIAHESDEDGDRYGLRVVAQVSVGGAAPSPDHAGPAPPVVDLCLGQWFSAETDDTSWLRQTTGTTYEPGLTVHLLRHSAAGELSFDPDFSLTSVGLNVRGGADAPLLDIDGVTLGGVELRLFLESTSWQFGFGARLDNVGFPLGQDFSAHGAGNPVAQSLLASGSDPAQPGQASTVDPPFSAEVAYVVGHKPLLEMVDAEGKPSDVVWIPMQRRFGPLSCQRVGVRLSGPAESVLEILFDGSVSVGGLEIDLDELSVGIRLDELADPSGYQLDVQGLDVAFSGGGVTIAAGLRKVPVAGGGVEYDGDAIFQMENLALHALGSYASLPQVGTSLFVFAWLNAPIGGPACLFVTGVAGGFGYNRRLRVPALVEVDRFPFVAGLAQPSILGGTNPTPGDVLATLASWVPPQRGEYWMAAGVQFTTYEIVKTNALLIVELGDEFSVGVVGASILKQPQAGFTFVYAELDIEAVFQPSQGEIRASAVLAPNSYVLTKDAHLTGGFAFAAWFGASPHAGDFVLTLGGYHPAFLPPTFYPKVEPVGINWQLGSHTALVGGAYFALTPVAMMAGANVAVTFSAGPLKAWLKADANAILFWKPFYLVASVSVSVGVEFHLEVLFVDVTLSVELGADFELWGPPVGFRVHVHWYIVSFTIGSGRPSRPSAISWTDFKAMLPSKPPVGGPPLALAERAVGEAAGDDPASTPAVLNITVTKGLLRSHQAGSLTLWLVRPRQFRMAVASAVPVSAVLVQSAPAPDICVRGLPAAMRTVDGGIPRANYRSTQTVALLRLQSNDPAHIAACMAADGAVRPPACTDPLEDMAGWEVDAVVQPLPQAVWGDPIANGRHADVNGPQPTVQATVGVTLHPKPPAITNCTPELNLDTVFVRRTVNADEAYRLPLSPVDQPCPDVPRQAGTFAALAAINDDAIAGARAALFAAVQELGVNGWTDNPLPRMAAAPGLDFADEPLEGRPVCTAS